MSKRTIWHENYENVIRLGAWLIENDKLESPAVEGLQYYYEKPWKWTPEWDEMNKNAVQTSAKW